MRRDPATAARWRLPRVRLSVRGLMVLVLIAGGGLGWVAHRARVQRLAVEAIEQAGGQVVYDWDYMRFVTRPDGQLILTKPVGQPRWKAWLASRIGPDYLGDIKSVTLGRKSPDEVMAHVGRLGKLEVLLVPPDTSLTEAGLVHLRRLFELRVFETVEVEKSGECLAILAGLRRLQRLFIFTGYFTDADVAYLGRLSDLEQLELPLQGITDAGLAHLSGLTRMRGLDLTASRVTSAGLAHLAGMTNLNRLSLAETGINDLAPIRNLKRLQELDLTRSSITDAGLAAIAGFDALEELVLSETHVSNTGLASLGNLSSLRTLGGVWR